MNGRNILSDNSRDTCLHTAYVALGANLGDRLTSISDAGKKLFSLGKIIAKSSVYQTEPWGVTEPQPFYLNQVCALQTLLTPFQLLDGLLDVERKMGRMRTKSRNAARLIDLDLLLFEDRVIRTDQLTVPHPRMTDRAFVLVGLAEIAPDTVHPLNGVTASDLLDRVDRSVVSLWTG